MDFSQLPCPVTPVLVQWDSEESGHSGIDRDSTTWTFLSKAELTIATAE